MRGRRAGFAQCGVGVRPQIGVTSYFAGWAERSEAHAEASADSQHVGTALRAFAHPSLLHGRYGDDATHNMHFLLRHRSLGLRASGPSC